MARAGAVLVSTLNHLQSRISAGVSTAELDRLAERFIRSQGAVPTFKGYRGFPGSICASPNDMVVHGIPGPYRLKAGDIISIDVGVTLDGWVADAARTFPVGQIFQSRPRTCCAGPRSRCMRASRSAGPASAWATCRTPSRRSRRARGCRSCARSWVTEWGRACTRIRRCRTTESPARARCSEEGMVIAVEPMMTSGASTVRVGGDGWAIFSEDSSPAAHFEFTVAITGSGPKVLTPWHLAADSSSLDAVAEGVASAR